MAKCHLRMPISLFQCFFFFFFLFFIQIHPIPTLCAATRNAYKYDEGIHPTKLVDGVCRRTNSSYSFCVESLYSDPRTPSAGNYVLAYISFGLAYLNASSTQQYVADLLNKSSTTAAGSGEERRQQLKTCYHDYNNAVSALELAYSDLNSETFFELADLAGVASLAAHDCQAGLNIISSPLAIMNRDLEGLCKICVVVSKLFTGQTYF